MKKVCFGYVSDRGTYLIFSMDDIDAKGINSISIIVKIEIKSCLS